MAKILRALGLCVCLCSCNLLGEAPSRGTEPSETTSAEAPPADPEALEYRTEIEATGDSDLDAALRAVSQLVQLQEQAPTGPLGLLNRARGDKDRFERALESEGYWGGTTSITIAGLPLDSPELLERLENFGDGTVPVEVSMDEGEIYRISEVSVRSATPEGARPVAAAAEDLGLGVGDPARAEAVLAAERRLLDRLLAAGHPLATVAGRDTVVDHDARGMRVSWRLAPGPAASFAAPDVEGAERVDTAFLERYLARRIEGDPYSPERLEEVRRGVMALGPFASVRVRAAERLDAAGRLPTTFTVAERPRHAIGFNAAYETNFGPAVRAYWEHRNLFGGAERLRFEVDVARIGVDGALDRLTYRGGAIYRDPSLFGRDLALVLSGFVLRERLLAYDRDAINVSVLFEERLAERTFLQAGALVDVGRSGPPNGPLDPYEIAGLTFGGRHDGTDSLLDPSRGVRFSGNVNPSYSFSTSAPFAPIRLNGSAYLDVFGNRRTILATRATLGSLPGAELSDIPRHIRFYAGGGGSVRGYDYQSIGPRDELGRLSGGSSLVEGSFEVRQRVWGDFGAVAFVDAGSVGTGAAPDFDQLRVGVGLGVRYYTAIGPIRADFALPLIEERGSSGYGIYVGIGQAF